MGNKAIQTVRRAVGAAAAGLVQEGMVVGIGSGATASCFIDALIERCRAGLSITGVASSRHSAHQAQQGNIPVVDIDLVSSIDLAIDGADEIDPQKRMIKGGGGALLREKIVASSAKEMIVIIDETKLVDQLGTFGLPLEILPFGHTHTLRELHELGYNAELRTHHSSEPYMTDNGNYICDLRFDQPIELPDQINSEIQQLAGVIATGLFLDLAGRVVIGYADGHVEVES